MANEKSPEEVSLWFSNKVSSILSGPRNSAVKHLRIVEDRIEDVKGSATRFDYSDIKDPDVYQNYATTIFEKTLKTFDEMVIPEEITYATIEEFHTSSTNQINSYINMLAKYLAWLKRDRSYKEKVKNLDRTLSRLKEEFYKFENKTLLSYSEIEKYEIVIDDLEILRKLIQDRNKLTDEIDSLAPEVDRITKMIDEREITLQELQSHPGFQQLEENKKEMAHIEISIFNRITEIKKLCSKVIKAADSRKIEIDEYPKEIMKALVKDPFKEIIKEGDGYSGIKSALEVLREKSTLPAIQMKKEKLERAFENIDEIIGDGLLELQSRAKFIIKQTEAIDVKFEEMEMTRKIKKLSDEADNLRIDRDRITLTQRRSLEEIREKISSLEKSISDQIKEYLDEDIELNLE